MIRKYQYIEWLTSRGLRPKTIGQYEIFLENLISSFNKFDQENIDLFVAKYKGNVVRSFLKSYKSYLLRNPLSLNPAIPTDAQNKIRAIEIEALRGKKRKTPKVITRDEVALIYRKMETPVTKLMLHLSFYCGLRREEMLTLRAGMFNINSWEENPGRMGVLTLTRKRGKEGVVPVLSKIMKEVYDFLPDDFDNNMLLFPGENARTWNRRLSKASNKAIGRHINPHLLRHSVAMSLRGRGFAIDEIKEFLGHEDISTTQIYSRVTSEQLMKKFEDL